MSVDCPLSRDLLRINGKGYRSYKDLKKEYAIGDATLFIDHVQGDPFASPSSMRVRLSRKDSGFPDDTTSNRIRSMALRDLIARRFWESSRTHAKGGGASGNSGSVAIPRPGQTVLDRSSVHIDADFLEVRFTAGLPAFGRQVAGKMAVDMLLTALPAIIEESMYYHSYKESKLYRHISTVEDASFIRGRLKDMGLAAFIADGSILPRQSGVDTAPMRDSPVVFRSPDSLRIRIRTPNSGDIWGMGIPRGVTVIVGGGYHGKSTLLEAITHGVYDHIPGDGRELAVTCHSAVKVRVEDGRRVEAVDIHPFIGMLPGGMDTHCFRTDNASGSTSQAANIMEALEMGTELLLIDEDSSASNFMVRDRRMQELVPKGREPITPFIDRVRQLRDEMGISTVMVIGGSGEYLEMADTVLMMDSYEVIDVTARAQEVVRENPSRRLREGGDRFGDVVPRHMIGKGLDPSKGRKEYAVAARSLYDIQFGNGSIDLSALMQLEETSQTQTIADAIVFSLRLMDGSMTLPQIVDEVMRVLNGKGLDGLGRLNGEKAGIRRFELAAAINRMRDLQAYQIR